MSFNGRQDSHIKFTITNKDTKELDLVRLFLLHPIIEKRQTTGLGWNEPIRYEPVENLGEVVIDIEKDKTYISQLSYNIVIAPQETKSFIFKYSTKTEHPDNKQTVDWEEFKIVFWFQSSSFSDYIIKEIKIDE
ncbi:hypothetical protein [Flavobacterium sp.]|uniref:hypothetical protein n=1 Tax=Flavobacterium sp. TaxID=239 RepID=UPI0026238088|nr:hypothetical protein [Flavobacterium sp.]